MIRGIVTNLYLIMELIKIDQVWLQSMHKLYGQSGLISVKDLTWESRSPVSCLSMDLINQLEKNFGPGQSIGLVKQDLENFKSRGTRTPVD